MLVVLGFGLFSVVLRKSTHRLHQRPDPLRERYLPCTGGTDCKSDPQKAFELDGSNYSISVKLLEMRDTGPRQTHQHFHVEPLWVYMLERPVQCKYGDTIGSLLNKKRNKQNVPSLEVVEKSGRKADPQRGSLAIPTGKYAPSTCR